MTSRALSPVLFVSLFSIFFTLLFSNTVAASNLIISTPNTFASLDGSASDNDGLVNGILTVNGDLTIQNGGSITCNDPGSSGNSACPIKIVVSGNMEMQAGSTIVAENRNDGGNGGNVTISVGGNFTMKGTSGSIQGGNISSSKTAGSGDTGNAGNITITVTGNIQTEPGSKILANSHGSAGAIEILSNGVINIDGLVASESTLSGTGANQKPGGGTITIISQNSDSIIVVPGTSCDVFISGAGVVSSKGRDPGADLVHIQGCRVCIYGLVQSTGAGHAIPNNPPNHCDSSNRPDKPSASTACVEIWAGNSLIIDNSTTGRNGEINADTGDGGTQGTSWIDLFARGGIQILGGSGRFAVHANGLTGTDDNGGLVNVTSINGEISTSGRAVQASATGAGGDGGTINLKAKNNIDLDASIFAVGDAVAMGGYGSGGKINVRSFSGNISWQNGIGDVQPTGTLIAAADRGVITLTACGTVTTTGTTFPVTSGLPTTPTITTGTCSPTAPSLPTGVSALPVCGFCGDGIIQGTEQCEKNTDCSVRDCDYLDGCHGNDYYDYTDVSNTCLGDCTCTNSQCGSPTISYNDPVCTGCQINSDCNSLDRDYCDGNLQKHDEGVCIDYECKVTTTSQDCYFDYNACAYYGIYLYEHVYGFCNPTYDSCDSDSDLLENCDDGNSCTADSCSNLLGGCQHTPIAGCCNTSADCNDQNVCTNDACNENNQCVHTNNSNSCDDGNSCTENDVCSQGSCHGTPIPNCGTTIPSTSPILMIILLCSLAVIGTVGIKRIKL